MTKLATAGFVAFRATCVGHDRGSTIFSGDIRPAHADDADGAGRRLGQQRMQWLRDFRTSFLTEWESA